MSESFPAANVRGPGIQQSMLAVVPSAQTPHGDYGVQIGVTHVLPGAGTDELRHEVAEVVVVWAGELESWVGDDRAVIRTGDHFVVEPGAWHRFANRTDSVATMLFAFGGDPAPVSTHRDPGSHAPG